MNETITFRRRRVLLILVLLLLALAVAVGMLELRLGRGSLPPTPTITRAPLELTIDSRAVLEFEGGDEFECALDSTRFSGCSSPLDYGVLARGPHTFFVRAVGADGRHSDAARAHWTIVRARAGSGTAGSGSAAAGGESFLVRGGLTPSLAPGIGGPLRLHVRNPHPYAIEVTSIVVSVARGSTRRGCDGRVELVVRQSNVASGRTVLRVPPHAAVKLPARGATAPLLRMRNRPVSQDACKGARFMLRYSGVARRARGA